MEQSNEVTLSKTQMETLCKMLAESQIKGGLVAQQGTNMTAFGGLTTKETPRIIDSGASNHMTGCKKLFSSYVPSLSNQEVRIADDSFSLVAGIGTVQISSNILLKVVLHVSKLSCNLLSISKLTRDLNCVTNFTSSTCVIQDQISGRMIGNAKEFYGLYYFENLPSMSSHVQAVMNKSLS